MEQPLQSSGISLATPIRPQIKNTTHTINLSQKSKAQHFLNKHRQKLLINGLRNYHGKNLLGQYKSQFNFKQKWEEQPSKLYMDQFFAEDYNTLTSIFYYLVLVVNCIAIWSLSFQRYFNNTLISDQLPVYPLIISFQAAKIIIRQVIRQQKQNYNIQLMDVIKLHLKEGICLLYFIFLQLFGHRYYFLQGIVEIVVFGLLWKNSSHVYKKFKVQAFALKYEYQIKIFDLLINIFVQAHIFAILMYSAAKFDPDNNWTVAGGIRNFPLLDQYIYAFYFSSTTMLTIGYGDITPKNTREVLVVVLIQIIGVISFGYLLNQMGHTLSKMRSKTQQIQKNLQTIGKMATFYNLEKHLQNKAKVYILNNSQTIDQFKENDQNRLLNQLNDQLRTQIKNVNLLSVVKSSIFFLCHWSKSFQQEIAKNIEKRVCLPNESLSDAGKNGHLYIIKKGKVCVYMNRFNTISQQKKMLRTINITGKEEVCDNVYGYTSFFSNRPVRLTAICRELAITYSISKEKFMNLIHLNKLDFEYFHQIKSKIDQSFFTEEWQVPSIKNIRQHYIPNRLIIIKKYRTKTQTKHNNRTNDSYKRRQKGIKRKCILLFKIKDNIGTSKTIVLDQKTLKPYEEDTYKGEFILQIETQSARQITNEVYDVPNIYDDGQFNSAGKVSSEQQSSIQDQNLKHSAEYQNISKSLYLARIYQRTKTSPKHLEEKDNKKKLKAFQTKHDYKNFFPRNNFNHIIDKLQNESYFGKAMRT